MSNGSSREDRLPWMQFNPNDWWQEPGLRAATLATRGAWIDICCLMWKSPHRGVLELPNGCSPSTQEMARILGCSEQEWSTVEAELYGLAIADKSSDGRMICRRMVREASTARARSEKASKGGKAKAERAQKMLDPVLPLSDIPRIRETENPKHRETENPKHRETENREDDTHQTCASESNSPAPPDEKSQPARPRSFRERLVDGCLLAFGKRYAATRGQEYPGGLPALRESGFGIVTKRLKTLCLEVPYRKAQETGMTPEQIESLCKAALKTWGGYLDRAAAIHEAAKGIPGKDGDWLRFPDTVAKFCGRIPKLTSADVSAAQKRAADVAEARKNQKRMNPDAGPSIRYGEMEKVIP